MKKKHIRYTLIGLIMMSLFACGGLSVCECLDTSDMDEEKFEACTEKMKDMTYKDVQETIERCEEQ
jgi:hypothetical protein